MVYKGMVYKGKYSISEKIRVYKCPFSDNFKGIFLSEYSDYEMIKGGYKGTTSTHSKVLIRLSCR